MIRQAAQRLKGRVRRTPLLISKELNDRFGNHARAVARAATNFGLEATLYMPRYASTFKQDATRAEGAKLVICEDRNDAEQQATQAAGNGTLLIPPYDHDDVIAGQGTACLEALEDAPNTHAVFAPCGGGGLLSGTLLAARTVNPKIKIFGAEPLVGNDAARSLRDGKIFRFEHSPKTIADGAMTLSVSPRTFFYLQQLDGFYEIEEDDILKWTLELNQLFQGPIEPTAALGLAAAVRWCQHQKSPQQLIVLLSGGNVSPD